MTRVMRKALALVKVQAQKGVMETPTAGDNAVLIEVPENFVQYNHSAVQPNNVRGSLDQDETIATGMHAVLTLSALLKGSGAVGVAPEFGPLLRACGWAETLFAEPIAAESAAGGSTTTAQLGSGAGSNDNQYLGAPILLTGGPVLDTFITGYAGSTKTAELAQTAGAPVTSGTDYSIPAHAKYLPASASIPYLTIWIFVDGKSYRYFDCQGTFELPLAVRDVGRLNFTFTGFLASEIDAALPGGAVYDNVTAPVWIGGKLFHERVQIAANSLRLTNGNQVQLPDDPNAPEGYGAPFISGRKITAQLDPQEELVATTDHIARWRAGVKGSVLAGLGSTAGNRVAVILPEAKRVDPPGVGGRQGLAIRDVSLEAAAPDAGAVLTFW